MFTYFIHYFHTVPHSIYIFDFLWIFAVQVGAGRTREDTEPKVHMGIDLVFADVPENLRIPSILASTSDVP